MNGRWDDGNCALVVSILLVEYDGNCTHENGAKRLHS